MSFIIDKRSECAINALIVLHFANVVSSKTNVWIVSLFRNPIVISSFDIRRYQTWGSRTPTYPKCLVLIWWFDAEHWYSTSRWQQISMVKDGPALTTHTRYIETLYSELPKIMYDVVISRVGYFNGVLLFWWGYRRWYHTNAISQPRASSAHVKQETKTVTWFVGRQQGSKHGPQGLRGLFETKYWIWVKKSRSGTRI